MEFAELLAVTAKDESCRYKLVSDRDYFTRYLPGTFTMFINEQWMRRRSLEVAAMVEVGRAIFGDREEEYCRY